MFQSSFNSKSRNFLLFNKKFLKMERLNHLIEQKQTNSQEFYDLLLPGYSVLIGGDEENQSDVVLVMSAYENNLFGLSKEYGGVMSFSLSDIRKVVSFSQEAHDLYEKMYELC
ncbi:hypothetical protein [Brazilian marseillevirus]|uniref:hypothetical protein n=1 Tax=Brazilian marseillevirus TaxID=1813599 RepID=UPI0007840191|nr:hypothetical protein A3303_gp059 [Brazilian marseillevirus]AMQ10567.1 hypothetical protein [Brazilian marseillevirus]